MFPIVCLHHVFGISGCFCCCFLCVCGGGTYVQEETSVLKYRKMGGGEGEPSGPRLGLL